MTTAATLHIIDNFFSVSGGTVNKSRFLALTIITYFDLFESLTVRINASKKITNKLNKVDLDKLFAVVLIFINVHVGSGGATGEIATKNSYTIINNNNNIFKANVFELHKYHASVE
jgi:hypothetical protein